MFEYLQNLYTTLLERETLFQTLQVIFFAVVAWIVLKGTIVFIIRFPASKLSKQSKMVVKKILNYTGMTIIIIAIMSELGFNLNILLGTAGVAGIALGFASQTSLSNIVSGLFLIAEKPFEIGDIIKVSSYHGIVDSVDLLSVRVRTFDNRYIRIPNESIIKSELVNITRYPIRRLDILLTVEFDTDLDKMKSLLLKAAHETTSCLDNPEPLWHIKEITEGGIEILFGAWFVQADYMTLKNSLIPAIITGLAEEGIELPYKKIQLTEPKSIPETHKN